MSDSENNGNIGEQSGPNGSVEDLSVYTDADESVSAPTEILAEFLSAIMLKDYGAALKYCKLILHYEPNNSTAREFYPFIQEKIELMRDQCESDDESSSEYSESSSNNDSNHSSSSGEENELKETDSDATSASYSSLEDEEADRENNVIETGSASLTSNDIANGNTERAKLESSSESETGRTATAKSNENEELKRKLGNFVGCKGIIGLSSDQTKGSLLIRNRANSDRSPVLDSQFINDSWSHGTNKGPTADDVVQPDDVNRGISGLHIRTATN